MLTNKDISSLCSNLLHNIRPIAKGKTKISRQNIGLFVALSFNKKNIAELSKSGPHIISPDVCRKFLTILFDNTDILWNVLPIIWPWPKDTDVSSIEMKALWLDCLDAKKGELYDTDVMQYLTPLALPDGKGKWIISSESPTPIKLCKAMLGEENVTSPQGHNQFIKKLKAKVDIDDHEAMHQLAIIYIQAEDYKLALPLLKLASDAGITKATYLLGMMNQLGMGINKDIIQAKHYYLVAAEDEEHQALHALGVGHDIGGAFDTNPESAFLYHQRAVEAGNIASMGCLAALYHYGRGVSKDLAKTKELLIEGAKSGEAYSANLLATIIENENGFADENCFSLYELAAERGESLGNYNLARCYLHGQGRSKNVEKAISHFVIAAEQGDTDAMADLGLVFRNGDGVAVDYEASISWLLKAVNKGCSRSMNILGIAYLYGYGVEKDLTEANDLFEESAGKGDPEAMFNLSISYSTGRQVKINNEKAFELCLKAAEMNILSAMNQVGIYYLQGVGIKSSPLKALHWIELAAEQGHPQAKKNLPVIITYLKSDDSVNTEPAERKFIQTITTS